MLADRPDSLALAAGLNMPVLLMREERDAVITDRMFRQQHQALPRARAITVTRAGHVAMLEQPDLSNALLDTFLDEQVAGTA